MLTALSFIGWCVIDPGVLECNMLAFFQEFFQGAKSIVMQISFVMLIFLLFSDKISGGQTASGGDAPCGRKPAWRGGAHFLRISTTCLGKNFAFQYPVSELNFQKTIGKTVAYCFEQIVVTCLGIFGQFLYSVQEFKLKNDNLKNGTSV